jgi:hypothetical protein
MVHAGGGYELEFMALDGEPITVTSLRTPEVRPIARRASPQSQVGGIQAVLQFCLMSTTLTIRLTPELAEWLKATSRRTGLPAGRIVREQLERAKTESGGQRFSHLIGAISGLPDLSSRKGYSRR